MLPVKYSQLECIQYCCILSSGYACTLEMSSNVFIIKAENVPKRVRYVHIIRANM